MGVVEAKGTENPFCMIFLVLQNGFLFHHFGHMPMRAG